MREIASKYSGLQQYLGRRCPGFFALLPSGGSADSGRKSGSGGHGFAAGHGAGEAGGGGAGKRKMGGIFGIRGEWVCGAEKWGNPTGNGEKIVGGPEIVSGNFPKLSGRFCEKLLPLWLWLPNRVAV